jgi:hypothetical protein
MRFVVPVLFFLLSCAPHPEPEWITSQPQAEGYWFGIGTVQKPFYGNDCREEALNKALAEISIQISVQVSGSFKRVVEEHNLNLNEITKSVIQTRVDNTLPDIEPVGFFDNKDRCGILARLSKSTYYETIEKQRRNAVKTALGLLDNAESEFNIQSFRFLSEAMNEIAPYIDVPIQEEYPVGSGKIVNLYSYVKLLANAFINQFRLVPDQETVEMKLGFSRDIQLGIKVVDNNSAPIENVPVNCYVDENEKGSFALSDADGKCIFSVPSIADDKPIQYVNFEVNMDEMIESTQLFGVLPQIQVQSILKVIPPQIFIQIAENNLGEATVNPYIQPVIMEFFSRHLSANFVDNNDADLIISGTVNTRSNSDTANDFGIYQVFGDFTISISNGETGEEILKKSFNKVQGSDFQSNKEAANQSLKKISEKITEDLLPEIIELIKEK